MLIGFGWWAQHWSEVAAVVLVASFVALVGQAVRSSLFLGQVATSRKVRKRLEAASEQAGVEDLRVVVARLERRVAELEGRRAARGPVASPPLIESSATLEERIESLAAEGRTPAEIARIVEEPTGRVELILNLRRTAGRA